jgi:hypothetical protein
VLTGLPRKISTTRRHACLKFAVELKEERADPSLLNAQ